MTNQPDIIDWTALLLGVATLLVSMKPPASVDPTEALLFGAGIVSVPLVRLFVTAVENFNRQNAAAKK